LVKDQESKDNIDSELIHKISEAPKSKSSIESEIQNPKRSISTSLTNVPSTKKSSHSILSIKRFFSRQSINSAEKSNEDIAKESPGAVEESQSLTSKGVPSESDSSQRASLVEYPEPAGQTTTPAAGSLFSRTESNASQYSNQDENREQDDIVEEEEIEHFGDVTNTSSSRTSLPQNKSLSQSKSISKSGLIQKRLSNIDISGEGILDDPTRQDDVESIQKTYSEDNSEMENSPIKSSVGSKSDFSQSKHSVQHDSSPEHGKPPRISSSFSSMAAALREEKTFSGPLSKDIFIAKDLENDTKDGDFNNELETPKGDVYSEVDKERISKSEDTKHSISAITAKSRSHQSGESIITRSMDSIKKQASSESQLHESSHVHGTVSVSRASLNSTSHRSVRSSGNLSKLSSAQLRELKRPESQKALSERDNAEDVKQGSESEASIPYPEDVEKNPVSSLDSIKENSEEHTELENSKSSKQAEESTSLPEEKEASLKPQGSSAARSASQVLSQRNSESSIGRKAQNTTKVRQSSQYSKSANVLFNGKEKQGAVKNTTRSQPILKQDVIDKKKRNPNSDERVQTADDKSIQPSAGADVPTDTVDHQKTQQTKSSSLSTQPANKKLAVSQPILRGLEPVNNTKSRFRSMDGNFQNVNGKRESPNLPKTSHPSVKKTQSSPQKTSKSTVVTASIKSISTERNARSSRVSVTESAPNLIAQTSDIQEAGVTQSTHSSHNSVVYNQGPSTTYSNERVTSSQSKEENVDKGNVEKYDSDDEGQGQHPADSAEALSEQNRVAHVSEPLETEERLSEDNIEVPEDIQENHNENIDDAYDGYETHEQSDTVVHSPDEQMDEENVNVEGDELPDNDQDSKEPVECKENEQEYSEYNDEVYEEEPTSVLEEAAEELADYVDEQEFEDESEILQ
jgi:hypothetical protein